jgi:hypothetical protein
VLLAFNHQTVDGFSLLVSHLSFGQEAVEGAIGVTFAEEVVAREFSRLRVNLLSLADLAP